MIEERLVRYLSQNIDVPVLMEVPEVLPDRFVVIEKTGSYITDRAIKTAVFALQSYALSMYDSAVLNEELKNVMFAMIELDDIINVELESDYNFTDPNIKRYRYQCVFDIRHY